MSTNATLVLFDIPIPVQINLSGSVVTILDANGQPFPLPDDVKLDFKSGMLTQGGEKVGEIQGYSFAERLEKANPFSASTSSTSGSGDMTDPYAIDPAAGLTTTPTATPAPRAEDPVATGTTSGREFATATLTDGGVRPPAVDPALKAPLKTTKPLTTKPLSSGVDVDDLSLDTGSTSTGPLTLGPQNTTPTIPTTPRVIPKATGTPIAAPSTGPSASGILNMASMGLNGGQVALGKLGMLQSNASKAMTGSMHAPSGLESMNGLGKGFAIGGAVASAAAGFLAAKNGNHVGVGMSTGTFALSLYQMGMLTNPYAWAAYAGAVASGYLIKKYGESGNQDLDPTKGDVVGSPWYQRLPGGEQNVFMIVTGMALMGLGLDLSVNSPPFQSIPVNTVGSVTLLDTRQGLYNSVSAADKPYLGGQPTSVLGKVFIQSAGNNGITPDSVVFVTPENSNTYVLHKETLDFNGYVVGEKPGKNRVPFFEVNGQGAVVPTSYGQSAMTAHTAMANTAASVKASAFGRSEAVRRSTIKTYSDLEVQQLQD